MKVLFADNVNVALPALTNAKVLSSAASVIIPVIDPAPVCVTFKLPAVIAAAVNSSVLIVISPSGVVPPTAPTKVTSPVPFVVISKLYPPSNV